VISVPDSNRLIVAYHSRRWRDTRARFCNDHNGTSAVKTAGPVVFTSAAANWSSPSGGLNNVALWKDNGDGTAVYSIDLSR